MKKMDGSPARSDGVSRIRPAAPFAFTLMAIVVCLFASRSGKPVVHLNVSGFTDPEVLERIVQRVRAGQDYYQAAGEELRADHFHVRSIFNWRQPLYAWFLASFPKPIAGQIILGGFAVAMTGLAVRFMLAHANPVGAVLALALIPAASFCAFVGWGATTLEIWAGVLIAISVLVFGECWWLGIIAALLALFIRELAGPYVGVCVAMAMINRRWREVVAWGVGLAMYAAYFLWHVSQVLAKIRPTDLPDAAGWVQRGGLHFILTTAAQNGVFWSLPLWVVAIYLPLAVLGLLKLPGEVGKRASATVGAYFLLFAIVGKPFNDYWGFVYSPLLALGFAWMPRAVGMLWGKTADASDFSNTRHGISRATMGKRSSTSSTT